MFLIVGGKQSTRSKHAPTQGEDANSTLKGPTTWEFNPGPSCCEATALATAPLSRLNRLQREGGREKKTAVCSCNRLLCCVRKCALRELCLSALTSKGRLCNLKKLGCTQRHGMRICQVHGYPELCLGLSEFMRELE